MCKKRSRYLFYVSMLLAVGCGDHRAQVASDIPTGIINGTDVGVNGKFGNNIVALVRFGDQQQALCTATLISSSVALTAAHCLEGSPDQLYVVFAPDLNTGKNFGLREVDEFIQNPAWHGSDSIGSKSGDLGLVHFQGDIPAPYAPAELYLSTAPLPSGEWVTEFGYGVTDPNSQAGPGVLRQTEAEIQGYQNQGQVVLAGEDSGVCFGDSGGPVMYDNLVWAVNSAVTSDQCDAESVHTLVAPFSGWIQAASTKLESSD